MIFIYRIKIAILVKKLKIVVKNAKNNVLIMYIFYKKNVVNI